MKRLLTALLVSMLTVIAVSGCEESNRRAEQVAIENLRVKMSEKDTRIAELESELEKCEDKNKLLTAQSQKAGAGFMQIFASTNEKVVRLEKENKELKAKIEELEKK